jgi:hypothetical protein
MERIALDRYVYEDIYPAFKAATDEKAVTARINRRFLNYLARKDLGIEGNEPILTADIGCGPCDTLIKYLSGVFCQAGFDVRATDYLSEYADPKLGSAHYNLAEAQANGTLKLARFSVKPGDAFSGNLLRLLASDGANSSAHAFRLIFASHLMYHAKGIADVRRPTGDLAANLLGRNGIAILYHGANNAGTFQDFRARFGSRSDGPLNSNTGAVTVDDPPAQITSACDELRLPLYKLEFVADLRFGPLNDEDWRTFADPLAYELLAERNPDAYEDLKKLYFVVQRAPLEFANDNSAIGLSNFIVQIRQAIEKNRGVLPLAESMQVFIREDVPDNLRLAILEALAAASEPLTD